ncbi:Hypothetical protein PHPALM_36220 [Phytophthora palmivora]|uniref:UDENN domain-containing protein n=1 Tax=Phytophthora palmivora TaxID=4796 RepID=A0A2P4X0H3_9STRA|nr:Hypothetical protein PHPALM_36220 [Phytophthora palmivora]
MSQVHVVVDSTRPNGMQPRPSVSEVSQQKYVGWIPLDYLVGQLKHDVGRYWQLKTSKYELCDPLGNILDDEKPLDYSSFHPAVLNMRRRGRVASMPSKTISLNKLDPFWIQDQLFDLFIFNALQNRQSSTLRITSYQFKLLLQKSTSKTIYQHKKKLLFDKRVGLAFRGAQSNFSNSDGWAGLSFDEYLDALVDVACFMYPKESSKELALEKLAVQNIIPYHEEEQCAAGSDTLSWTQVDNLASREKVKSVVQRFTKTIGDLATSYSSNVGIAQSRCVLGYHEFHRFVRDIVPTTVPISSTEVCKAFMHYCSKEEKNRSPALEITCAKMINVICYIALVAVPRLVMAKEKITPDYSKISLTSKLGVQSLKTLLHHISNNLGAQGGAIIKKNVEFNRARAHFLLEFNKMHREDLLIDYQSNYDGDFDTAFSWDLDSADNANTEDVAYDSEASSNSPAEQKSVYHHNPEVLIEQRRRELEQLNALCNEADEIYAFLTAELQQHSLSKKTHNPDTVPHMLDVWVSAGEKYSDVVNHVETSSLLRAKFLSRFGRSLYVFATQVLKSTTKVYSYEELFYVTNARVYTTASVLWCDKSPLFTLDLAMESLSLASGKLTQACDELSALVTVARANNPDEGSDASSSGSDGEEHESWTASALYEKYLSCLYLRANCLAAYADVIAHNKKVVADYELGSKFEEAKQIDERTTTSDVFFTSAIVLSKTSSPSEFYWEAKKMYRFLLQHSNGGLNFSRSRLHHNLAMVQFKLATHIPRDYGDAEKQLLENALLNLDACEDHVFEPDILNDKRNYIRAVLAGRRKFFLTESQSSMVVEGDTKDSHQEQEEVIAPFYRFVLAGAFSEFDIDKRGVILHPELTLLSKACGYNAVSAESLHWLLNNFDHQDSGLTERGFLQYFCWLAEADPVGFCEIIDQLTAKHTGAHNISIFSGDCVYPRKHSSLKSTLTSVNCFVVLSGKMTKAAGVDVTNTTSPSDIRLEPEVVDMLPSNTSLPEELSKFCFPDDIYLSTEPFSPRTFDIVLTDVKGVRSFGSCLHFCEEKHPMNVLSLISATEKGRTVNLPSWVSLKDIQQGQTKWKCYVPKCLCVLSSSPLFQTFRTFLVYLYRLSLANFTAVSLESIIFNFLERTPLPNANSTQTVFKLAETTCLLSGFSPNLPLFSPTEVDFTILFQCLNPDNILKVYGYLLTEKKVVLSSTHRPILTHVAETLRALLHPFECQQVYIPLLPLSLVEFICAPVPFFMGIRSDQRLERLVAEGVILVDLDNNDIRVPPNEDLPVLTDVKSRKLLHTLRKLSIWPASQRTRHFFGRDLNTDQLPITNSFEPTEPSDVDVGSVVSRHEDLAEKWSEIQTLFSSFAMRILKDVRKHCTKTPAQGGNSSGTTVFDERSFLAMHPSLREFYTHLFQTQLFQRSIENIRGFSDTSIVPESRAVRGKGMLRKNSEIIEDTNKLQRPRVIQAPLPPRTRGSATYSTKMTGEGFPSFDGKHYDNLLDEFSDIGELESSKCDYAADPIGSLSSLGFSSEPSSSSVLTSPSFHDEDVDAFQLVNAARKRVEGRRINEIVK